MTLRLHHAFNAQDLISSCETLIFLQAGLEQPWLVGWRDLHHRMFDVQRGQHVVPLDDLLQRHLHTEDDGALWLVLWRHIDLWRQILI